MSATACDEKTGIEINTISYVFEAHFLRMNFIRCNKDQVLIILDSFDIYDSKIWIVISDVSVESTKSHTVSGEKIKKKFYAIIRYVFNAKYTLVNCNKALKQVSN